MAGGDAGGALVGGLIGLGATALSAGYARRAATTAYRRQKDFRSTAYQATMADMREAGLNPMLAFSKGPTSGGAVPMARQVDFSGIAGSARRGATLVQELKNLKAVRLKDDALRDQADSQISLNEAAEELRRKEAIQTQASAQGLVIQNAINATKLPAAIAEGDVDASKAGTLLRQWKRVTEGFFGGTFLGSSARSRSK